jgi:hypothetical protein
MAMGGQDGLSALSHQTPLYLKVLYTLSGEYHVSSDLRATNKPSCS